MLVTEYFYRTVLLLLSKRYEYFFCQVYQLACFGFIGSQPKVQAPPKGRQISLRGPEMIDRKGKKELIHKLQVQYFSKCTFSTLHEFSFL